jgi:hypothetical protein
MMDELQVLNSNLVESARLIKKFGDINRYYLSIGIARLVSSTKKVIRQGEIINGVHPCERKKYLSCYAGVWLDYPEALEVYEGIVYDVLVSRTDGDIREIPKGIEFPPQIKIKAFIHSQKVEFCSASHLRGVHDLFDDEDVLSFYLTRGHVDVDRCLELADENPEMPDDSYFPEERYRMCHNCFTRNYVEKDCECLFFLPKRDVYDIEASTDVLFPGKYDRPTGILSITQMRDWLQQPTHSAVMLRLDFDGDSFFEEELIGKEFYDRQLIREMMKKRKEKEGRKEEKEVIKTRKIPYVRSQKKVKCSPLNRQHKTYFQPKK